MSSPTATNRADIRPTDAIADSVSMPDAASFDATQIESSFAAVERAVQAAGDRSPVSLRGPIQLPSRVLPLDNEVSSAKPGFAETLPSNGGLAREHVDWIFDVDSPAKWAAELSASLNAECYLFSCRGSRADLLAASQGGGRDPVGAGLKHLAIEAAGCGNNLCDGLADPGNVAPSAIAKKVREDRKLFSVFASPLRLDRSGSTFVLVALKPAALSAGDPVTDQRIARGVRSANDDFIAAAAQAASCLAPRVDVWLTCRRANRILAPLRRLRSLSSRRLPWAIAAAIAALLAVPLPYHPKRICTFEPAQRQFVTTPAEGVLRSAEVRPGDHVTAGQILATLDDTELRRDLAIAKADLQTASKRREVAMALSSGAEMRLASLEAQQAEIRIQSIQSKLSLLEVRSPIDGVVVHGDWIGSENIPLESGKELFEISDLRTMIARVELLPEDLVEVGPGCVVDVSTSLAPLSRRSGIIRQVSPHAEITDGRCVFFADAEFTATDLQARPGLVADARLRVGYRTIFWQILDRPVRWAADLAIW